MNSSISPIDAHLKWPCRVQKGEGRGRSLFVAKDYRPSEVGGETLKGESRSTFIHLSPSLVYSAIDADYPMSRRMPRPEDVSRDHIDMTVLGFLRGEKEVEWTEVSL